MVDEVFGPFQRNPHLFQVFQAYFREATPRNNQLGGLDANARDTKEHLVIGHLDIYREKLRMPKRPSRLRVQFQVEIRIRRVDDFVVAELVESHQPVSLVKPVLTDKRRLRRECGKPLVGIQRHIARKIHALHLLLLIEAVRKRENLQVGLPRRTDNHLGTLPRRQEPRRIPRTVGPVFQLSFRQEIHGPDNRCMILFGSQVL